MKKLNWTGISKYRGELCGFSIITIIIFHYFYSAADVSGMMKTIRTAFNACINSTGVDLFLLLSGFGIVYSLNKDSNPLSFYRKRFERVVFPYLVMGGIHWILKDLLISSQSIGKFFLDWSLLSFWTRGNRTFWYISLICILYLVSPFVFGKGKKGIIAAWVISIAFNFALYYGAGDLFKTVEVATQRMPVYFMGMYFGMMATEKKDIHPGFIAAALLFVPVRFLAKPYKLPLYRLIDGPYVFFFILLYIALRTLAARIKEIRLLSLAGKYSLELYILHVSMRQLLMSVGVDLVSAKKYALMIIAVIPLAVAFSSLQTVWKKPAGQIR